ncbi:MAG: hypothetical protein V4707_12875 [Pseudomonadota bacterium]
MEQRSSSQGAGCGPYVVAGLSFIPLIGVLFGLGAIIWGAVTWRRGGKWVVLLGALGILFTIGIYSALFYFGFVQRGGVYDGLRAQLAVSQLNQLVPYVELYKQQNGRYPASLKDVAGVIPPNTPVMINDPSHVDVSTPREFFYQQFGDDHYYLRGLGLDGQPFTADDILPEAMPATGLLIEAQPAPIEPPAPQA